MTLDLSVPPGGPGTRVEVAVASERGLVRDEQQDAAVCGGWVGVTAGMRAALSISLVSSDDSLILAVVDGMGGHAGGAAAAAIAASALASTKRTQEPNAWASSLEQISDRVGQAGAAWGTPDMGATVAAVVIGPEQIEVLGVGDCRVMRIVDGYVGTLSVEDRAPDPRRPGRTVVTQSLGGPPRSLDPRPTRLRHSEGHSRYLLCTDGLHDTVPEDAVRAILARAAPPADVAQELIGAAYAAGAPDNVTVIVADVVAPVSEV